jgi:hypothetical protein
MAGGNDGKRIDRGWAAQRRPALATGADWVAEQVVAGQRESDLDAIQDAVSNRGLRAGPTRTIVSIATLAPDRLAAQAAHAIDWVDRFDGPDAYAKRRPKPPATWQQLQADIEDIPGQLGVASHVAITGSLRLAPAFTVGAALRMVTSTDIAVMQRGTPWTSDAPYTTPITPASAEYDIGQGDDIAIAIEVATTMTADVQAFLLARHIPVGRLVVLGSPGGPRDNAVGGPEQACALVVGLRDHARRAAHDHPRVHLFLATPMGRARASPRPPVEPRRPHHRLRGPSRPRLRSLLHHKRLRTTYAQAELRSRRAMSACESRSTTSMRTRSLASAVVSSCVWMAGKAKESNALIGSMCPGVGRRWLPSWLPRVDGHRGRPPR